METHLANCPFCGEHAKTHYDDKTEEHHVTCTHRYCSLWYDMHITLQEWNTRPLEDALQQKLDEAVNFIIPDEETYRKIMWNTLDRAVEIEEKRIEQQHQETGLYFDSEVE